MMISFWSVDFSSFVLMFPAILKLTNLQNFIFTKFRALTLTEFLYCYRDCYVVSTRDSYILKPTTDRAFRKNTSWLITANFFQQKAPEAAGYLSIMSKRSTLGVKRITFPIFKLFSDTCQVLPLPRLRSSMEIS